MPDPRSEHPDARSHRPRALSITVLAPLVLAAPVVIVSIVLGALAVYQSRRDADELAQQIVDQIDERVGARIGDLARTAMRVNEQNAHLVEIGVFHPDDLRAWLPTMRRQMAIFRELNGIAWGDEHGHATWLVGYPGEEALEYAIKDEATGGLIEQYALAPDGSLSPEPLRRLEYDPRVRPWYLAGAESARTARGAAWSPVYSWRREDGSGETLGISYSRAITRDGAMIGVLDTELELHSVSRFMQTLRIAETGAALLIDRQGGLVAASRAQPLVSPDGTQILAPEAGDPVTRAAAEAALLQVPSLASLREPVRAAADIAGERAWIGVSPLQHASGLDWLLITVVPERDLLARVEQARSRAALAALVAFLATLAAGIAVARVAVRPIVKLRDHVHRVGEGDLAHEVHLRGTSELVELSHDINHVTRGLLDRARMGESLRVAMEVQQALLPVGAPRVPGLDIAGFSRYCDETGGDYFDFVTTGDTRVQIALGDVVGHGVAAALLMATARAVLRSRWRECDPPAALLAFVNEQLVPDTGGTRFMTLLLMTVDGVNGLLRWSTAGQQPGLLYDAADGSFVELAGSGMPVGIDAGARYDDFSRAGVAPGSILLLTTDGLFEARNAARERFGWDRVRKSLLRRIGGTAAQVADGLYDDVVAFCGRKPEDDVTLVVVRFTGA